MPPAWTFWASLTTAPFVMREVVGDTLEIEVTREVSLASVVTVNPITRKVSVEEYRGLEAGSSLRVKTHPPYTPIMIGGYVDGRPYEAWGMGLSPLEARLDLRAPGRIRPSESLPLEISTGKKAGVLLVVGDPRLLRAAENPCLELSASLFRSMAETARDWKRQTLQIGPGGRGLAPPAGETGERSAIRGATRSSMSDLDLPAFLRRGDPSSLRVAAGRGRGEGRGSFGRPAQDDPHPEPALGDVGGKEDPVASPDGTPLREEETAPLLYCRLLEVDRKRVELIKLLGLVAASSPKNGGPVVIIDGREALLDRILRGQRLEVKEGQVIARVEHEEMRDLREMKSNVPLRVEIDHPSPRLGEKVQITIRPEKEARSLLAYIDLPPVLAAVRFGAQVQRLCLPIEQGVLVLETVAIRHGRADLWVGLADMYDAGLWGTVPGIGVVVF